jgi:hypothetical protein
MKRAILALAIGIVACEAATRQEGILEQERFTEVLMGATLIEARINQEMTASPGDLPPMRAYYAELFAKHGTDSIEFRNSYDHYALRPEVMQLIYDDVVERLRMMRDESAQPREPANDTTLATDSSSVRKP